MTLRFLPTVATAFACATLVLHASNIVTFPFNGTLSPNVQDGVTCTGFGDGGDSDAIIGLGDNDGSYGYILITDPSGSVSDAVNNQQYAQFTISPPLNNGMQIAQIQIVAAKGGDSNPRGLALRWSFDNYQANLGQVDVTTTWLKTRTYTFNVNAFAGVPVSFRIYAFADEISKAEPSIRFDNLVVTGAPVIYPPTLTASSTFIQTTRRSATVSGSAYSAEGIRRVEFCRSSPNGVYSGANGTTNWNFAATNLYYRTTSYWVRAISNDNQYSNVVRVRIKRVKPAPTPTPKPTPSPTPKK